jgi:hypothetical protein
MREYLGLLLVVLVLSGPGCGLIAPHPGEVDPESEAGRRLIDRFEAVYAELECGHFEAGVEAAVLAGDLPAAAVLARMQRRHPCISVYAERPFLDLARVLLTGRSRAEVFPGPEFFAALCPAKAPPRPAPAVIDIYLGYGLEAARAAAPRDGPCRDALRAGLDADGGDLARLHRLSYLEAIDPLQARFARAGAACAAGHRACRDAATDAALSASIAAYEGEYEAVRLVVEHADIVLRAREVHTHEVEEARRIQAAVGAAYGHPVSGQAQRADAYTVMSWLETEQVTAGRAPPKVLAAAKACRGVEVLSFSVPPAGLDDREPRACWTALAELDPHRAIDRETRLLLALHTGRADGSLTGPGDLLAYFAGLDRDVFADVLYLFDFDALERDAFNCPRPTEAYRPVWERLPPGPDSAVCARLSQSGVAADDYAAQAALFDWPGCPVDALLDAPWHAGRVLLIHTRAGEARAFRCVYEVARAAEARNAGWISGSGAVLLAGVRLGHLPEAALEPARRDVLFDFAEDRAEADYGHLPGWNAPTHANP